MRDLVELTLVYAVKKVLKFKKNTVNWEAVFGEDDGEN